MVVWCEASEAEMNAEVVTWDAFDLDQLMMDEESSLTGELV